MRTLLFVLASLLACEGITAQTRAVPRFEDFPVSRKFTGKAVPVNLRSHPLARKFRTMLRASAEEGPNFAGHYTVTHWGCGSNCWSIAIIDARNGNVYFPRELPSLGVGIVLEGDNDEEPLRFSLGSRLLIAEGFPFFSERENLEGGRYYFKWENNRLRLVHKIRKDPAGVN